MVDWNSQLLLSFILGTFGRVEFFMKLSDCFLQLTALPKLKL